MKMKTIKLWEEDKKCFSGLVEGRLDEHNFSRYYWFFNHIEKEHLYTGEILEIGCNSSEALGHLADKGYSCTAVDLPIVIEAIEKSRFKNGKIDYIAMDVDQPDATSWRKDWKEKFDVIIMGEVLQHLIFDMNVLYAIWHYLKPGGLLLMSTELENLANKAVRYYPKNILFMMLRVLQFTIEDLTTEGQKNYIWMKARKIDIT